MFDMGVEVDPFGVGASTKIDAGAMIRGAVAGGTYLAEFAKNISAISSVLSPNLKVLGGEETVKVMGGTGLNQVQTGSSHNLQTYIGRTDDTGVYDTVNQETKKSSSEIMQVDIDEEKENMKKTQEAMKEIGDNVAFIVKLLNIDGIRVRSTPERPDSGIVAMPDENSNSIYMSGGR
jgi:hypothetical protein